MFLGSLAGIFFAFHMTDILDAMIIFNYPYMGSLLIPLLGGLVWKGATRKGAFAAAIAGGVVGGSVLPVRHTRTFVWENEHRPFAFDCIYGFSRIPDPVQHG